MCDTVIFTQFSDRFIKFQSRIRNKCTNTCSLFEDSNSPLDINLYTSNDIGRFTSVIFNVSCCFRVAPRRFDPFQYRLIMSFNFAGLSMPHLRYTKFIALSIPVYTELLHLTATSTSPSAASPLPSSCYLTFSRRISASSPFLAPPYSLPITAFVWISLLSLVPLASYQPLRLSISYSYSC